MISMKTSKLQKIVFGCLAILASAAMLHAANVTWDADTTTTGAQDGSGTWDAITANWWTGSANTTFNIATTPPDMPIFGALNGVAGTVTLGSAINSSNIIFNAPGVGNYTIAGSGANTLTLTNGVAILANVDATISASFMGSSGLTVSHGAGSTPSGVLILSGDNSALTGTFNIGENANNPNGVGAANTTCAVRPLSNTALGTGTIAFNSQGNQSTPRLELPGGITLTNPAIAAAGRNNSAPAIVALGSGNTFSGTFTRGTGGQDFHLVTEAPNGLTLSGATGTNGVALTSAAAAPRNYVLRGSGSGTVSGNIVSNMTGSAGNNIGIVKAGNGTWTLSGANAFTNGVIVDQGTLTLDYSSQNNAKLATTGPLTLGGGTVNLSGGSFLEAVASTTIVPGSSAVTRSSGSSTLRLNALTRMSGGEIDFVAASIADTTTLNVNGILGGYATLAGADWAINSTGGANGPITAYSGYTDIAASGSTIADGSTSNVRLNSVGGGGNIALGATTTTVNTLLQNTTTAATINTSTGTLRLGAIGGVLIPGGNQSLTFGTSANSGTLTAGGADNTAGELVFINNSGNDLLVNSLIADNGSGSVSLTKAGSGTMTLAGANTYTGRNVIAGGTLNVGSDSNLGTAPGSATIGNILINGGILQATQTFTLNANRGIGLGPTNRYGNGTISVASGQTLTYAGIVANTDTTGNGPGGSLTKAGSGTLVLLGINTYSLGTIVNAGTLQVTNDTALGAFFQSPGAYTPDNIILNGGVLDIEGSTTLSANRGILLGPVGGSGSGTISVGSGQTVVFNGRITDNWGGSSALTKSGAGALILGGGTSDYTGDTTVSAGMLQLANLRAIPNGSDKGNVIINNPGVLGIVTSNGVVALKGLSGNGTVDNPSNYPVGLTLGFYNTSSSFNGVIQNNGGGALTLTKTGGGTLTLGGGANTYTGNTLINNGVLALSGSGTITNSTNIIVGASGTLDVTGLSGGLTLAAGQQLSGSGTVLGNVTDPASSIAPGGTGTAGTLTFGNNLTLSGSGALNYDLANTTTPGSGINDLIVVNGTLDIAGTTPVNLNYLGGLPAVGTYILIQYGSLAGSVANLSVPVGFTLTNNTTTKTIGLIVTHVPASLTWAGDGTANVWDSGVTANWRQSGTNQYFYVGDSVTFDNTGSDSPAINLAGAMFPGAVTVNASQNYDFTGGAIGTGSLSKSGTGTLILENNNTYAGPTTINGGVVQVGNAGTSGSLGSGPVTNNASLVFNRTDAVTASNNISGSGTLTLAGTGDLTLSGSNSYAGLTTISSSGTLHTGNANALGAATAGLINTSGGKLYVDRNVNFPNEPLTLGGGTSLQKGGAGVSTLGGTVTLVSDTTFSVDGGATLNLTNASGINGSSANVNLTLAGTGTGNIGGPLALGTGNLTVSGGTWTVAPTNNYGLTAINGGALFITGPLSLGQPPGSFNASQVTLNGGTLGAATNVTLNDGNIGISVPAGVTTSIIVVNNTNSTLTISNNITGDATTALTKTGSGTLVLSGPNSFAGTLNIDGNSAANDGTTVIANNAAIANILHVSGSPFIFIRNNNNGSSTLGLDGSQGSITVAPDISLAGRNVSVQAIENFAGNNTISGNITLAVGGVFYEIQSDSGTLTLTAPLPYATPTSLPIRTNTFLGAGNILMSGVIQDGSINGPTNVWISVLKTGTGVLTLSATNTYTGLTVVSNGVLSLTGIIGSTNGVSVAGGLLVGTGTIVGPVTVQPGGAIEAGSTNTIGTLQISNTLVLSGNTIVKIDKGAGSAHDLFAGQTSVTYGGTLTVTNLSGTLTTTDTFTLFSPGASASNFASIIGSPGAGLAYSFTNGVLSVVTGVASNPTNITFHLSGSTLTLSWPVDHLGWILQSQTNGLGKGLSSNWVDVAGSGSSYTNVSTINPTNPTVFYRLRH